MVSTRQMATIISPGPNGNEYSVSIAAGSSSQSHANRSPVHQSQHLLSSQETNNSSSDPATTNDEIVMGEVSVVTSANPSTNDDDGEVGLLDLPTEILEKILSYTTYKKIAQFRLVSVRMNSVCSSILNSTFNRLQTQMMSRFQAVKAKMPRR